MGSCTANCTPDVSQHTYPVYYSVADGVDIQSRGFKAWLSWIVGVEIVCREVSDPSESLMTKLSLS